MLLGPAISAWHAAGEQWKACSSRLISTKMKMGKITFDYLQLSCYAPTRAHSREKKNESFQDLDI